MKFILNIDTGNAAFEGDPSYELVQCLERVKYHLLSGERYDLFQTIFDTNGNDVGRFALKPDDYR